MKKKKIKLDKIVLFKSLNLERSKRLKNYKGKKVLGAKGEKLGIVWDIVIDDNHKIIALVVMKWFKKYYFDINYIESMTNKNIMLSITPVTTLIGKQVFDVDGRLLGRVVKINKPDFKNNFTEIIVKKNFIWGKKIISKKEISTNKKNIILSTTYA